MVFSPLTPQKSPLDAKDDLLFRGPTDNEQREVYEAAMVIQRAYREYRARNTSRRQADAERNAAVTIQCCYRRYKQFCYFKKLHNAAIVVQKHFRMRKKDDKEEDPCEKDSVPEHPTLDGQSIRIQVPQNNSTLLRQHRAATTIQLAYRGHRKRQAAARKIQKVAENACAKRGRFVCDDNQQKRERIGNPSTWFYCSADLGANANIAVDQFAANEWDQLNESMVFVVANSILPCSSTPICPSVECLKTALIELLDVMSVIKSKRDSGGKTVGFALFTGKKGRMAGPKKPRRGGTAVVDDPASPKTGLGERSYRAESPSQFSTVTDVSIPHSEVSLPTVDYSKDDCLSWSSTIGEEADDVTISSEEPKPHERIVSREEIAKTEEALCKKLSLIVDLVTDFTNDATRANESAEDLLNELRTKVRVYLQYLDVEMKDAEFLLRFNVDRSTICDDRIDWLLHFTKCHKEMRRVLEELSEDVCGDLEECLDLRKRGIVGKKPKPETLNILSSMQEGMRVATQLLCATQRRRG
ncbi:unnamed protein product [Caenorhabditis auriculariae]|uniref:Uncharacterized protein n=1 Tax=Caenorhabditis auriculariae TaxID=2777116 RepID=A0A8S1HLV3_9PELO|nr:unnamed protein product [Caenorhabditis auriculariae]